RRSSVLWRCVGVGTSFPGLGSQGLCASSHRSWPPSGGQGGGGRAGQRGGSGRCGRLGAGRFAARASETVPASSGAFSPFTEGEEVCIAHQNPLRERLSRN